MPDCTRHDALTTLFCGNDAVTTARSRCGGDAVTALLWPQRDHARQPRRGHDGCDAVTTRRRRGPDAFCGHDAVTTRSRQDHDAVTTQSRQGHDRVTTGSRRGHDAVATRHVVRVYESQRVGTSSSKTFVFDPHPTLLELACVVPMKGAAATSLPAKSFLRENGIDDCHAFLSVGSFCRTLQQPVRGRSLRLPGREGRRRRSVGGGGNTASAFRPA